MRVSVELARDVAEALLDAVEMVYEAPEPVAIVHTGRWVVATRKFTDDEAILVVIPPEEYERGYHLRLVS